MVYKFTFFSGGNYLGNYRYCKELIEDRFFAFSEYEYDNDECAIYLTRKTDKDTFSKYLTDHRIKFELCEEYDNDY